MRLFPISFYKIHGYSMLPVLRPGDSVLCFNWAYIFTSPKAGDVVVVTVNGKNMVKRIKKINNGRIFLVGDNKKDSTDSRNFGWIAKTQVKGKVISI